MKRVEQQRSEGERSLIWLEVLFGVVFLVFSGVMILVPLGHTLELWDESRNANNAVEMVMRGHWLTPTYGWVSDHWNTKPPLLIWIIAGLERLGVAPIVALRLPSEMAALATVATVYFFCRNVLGRPFAAMVAAFLLMSSTLFFGLHVAMSGDYDALLCLLITLYSLGFFCFVEPVEELGTAGIALAGVALSLAILTKGIAGVLILPGLFLYAVVGGRLLEVLRDRRFWVVMLGVCAVTAAYYKGRDLIDPGYMHDVWRNELAGRYAKPNEGHHARTLYYANYLVHHFEPGIFVFLLGVFALRPRGGRRAAEERTRGAVLLCGIASITLLLVLTKAETKISYYCAPAVPLMSICGAVGLSEVLAWRASARGAGRVNPARLRVLEDASLLALLVGLCATTALGLRDGRSNSAGEQAQYGAALEQIRGRGIKGPVVLLDSGFETVAGFHAYDPVADYYAKEATRRRIMVTVQHAVDPLPRGAWVVSCDPVMVQRLVGDRGIAGLTLVLDGCVYGWAIP